MAYKPGQTVEVEIDPLPVGSSGSIYSFAWRWWDGQTQAGTTAIATKKIVMGGDPTNGDRLIYSCFPTMIDGSSGSIGGTIIAYHAPYVQNVTLSNNDDVYGYSTTLSLTAYSIDLHLPLTFEWFEGATSLGAGVNGATPTVSHTWEGNDKVVTANYSAQVNALTTTVAYDKVINCVITDTGNAKTIISFTLRGKEAAPVGIVLSGQANNTTTDATSLPIQRIGVGQTVTFVAYAVDTGAVMPNFKWDFSGSNGWTTEYFRGGADASLPDGSFSSTYTKDVSGEVVTASVAKVATAICRVTGQAPSPSAGVVTPVQFSVLLLRNNPPSATTITCTDSLGNALNMLTDTVPVGSKLIYTAVSTDSDLDIVTQMWRFDGNPHPNPLYVYGPKVVLDTTGYTLNATIQGQVTSTDRMGGVLYTNFKGPRIV